METPQIQNDATLDCSGMLCPMPVVKTAMAVKKLEIGQVLIICAIFPILFFIRKASVYPKILVYGSILLIAIAMYWFIERAFDVDLPVGRWILGMFG